ncbi:hypothetical protein STEG23_015302, partial [Scotinomys teguina]
ISPITYSADITAKGIVGYLRIDSLLQSILPIPFLSIWMGSPMLYLKMCHLGPRQPERAQVHRCG